MASFTPSGSGGAPAAPVSVVLESAQSPAIATLAMPTLGDEYAFTLPEGTRQFIIRPTVLSLTTVAYTSGSAATMTIPRGCFYGESGILLPSPLTVYLKSSVDAQSLEILYWI